MRKLRNKMVIFFLVITFVATLVSSLLDMVANLTLPILFDTEANLNAETEAALISVLIGYLLVNIGIYVVSGFIFYHLTKREIKKESERQVEEQNLLYAAIAHDLKTPMTSVQGYSKALADGKIKEEEKEEIYNIIYNKSKSMNSLVDTLFEYSKYGTSEYKPDLTDFDIAELLRGIIAENYSDLEEHRIETDIFIPDAPVTVNADKRNIARALSNLVINTCKHNPEGITLYVSLERKCDICVITIADTGNDIPQGMDIFEPFVTENSSRSTGGGTGLGLAITKRVIERHGGSISIERNVPGYTKAFIVKLKCR